MTEDMVAEHAVEVKVEKELTAADMNDNVESTTELE